MSNVIKSCRVNYSVVPHVIQIPVEPGEVQPQPEDGVRSEVRQAREYAESSRLQSLYAFVQGQQRGLDIGFAQGLDAGLAEGRAEALDRLRRAAEALAAKAAGLDAERGGRRAKLRENCIREALELAGMVLGGPLDPESPVLRPVLSAFLAPARAKAVLSAAGRDFPFDTLCPELLTALTAEGGSVVLRVEEPAAQTEPAEVAGPVAETESAAEAESMAETDFAAGEESAVQAAPRHEPEELEELEEPEQGIEEETEETDETEEAEEGDGDETLSGEEEAGEISFFDGRMALLRPDVRPARTSGVSDFEEIPSLPAPAVRAFFKKARPEDLAAALAGAADPVRDAFLAACPRSRKGVLLDAMRFLGPAEEDGGAAEEKALQARAELCRLAAALAGAPARGGRADG